MWERRFSFLKGLIGEKVPLVLPSVRMENGTILYTFKTHQNVESVAISEDGKTAFTASGARLDHSQTAAVMAWDLESGQLSRTYELEEPFSGWQGPGTN